MNTCIDCGKEYPYDRTNAKGSSTIRCSACRKRDTRLQKKIKLFSLTGSDRCKKCGYSHPSGLKIISAVSYLNPPASASEEEKRARKSYILCLNCASEVEAGIVEAKVISSDPVIVEFYETKVVVVKERKKIQIEQKSNDAIEVEVVDSEPRILRPAEARVKRIG